MIAPEDIALAYDIAAETGGFVTGSYLVSPDEAQDIDVLVPARASHTLVLKFGEALGKVQSTVPDEYVGCHELVATYRKGTVNVLVVNDDYVPAYKAARRHMRMAPLAYQDRGKRVALHASYKAVIRDMVEG